jgi:potassium channel subfamily K
VEAIIFFKIFSFSEIGHATFNGFDTSNNTNVHKMTLSSKYRIDIDPTEEKQLPSFEPLDDEVAKDFERPKSIKAKPANIKNSRSSVFRGLQYVSAAADVHTITNSLKKHNIKFLSLSCFVMIAFFFSGVMVYVLEDKMTVFNALYFCIITFLTIGYGDFVPTNNVSKIFTCFYILAGVGIVSTAIKYIVEFIIEEQEARHKANLKAAFLSSQTTSNSLEIISDGYLVTIFGFDTSTARTLHKFLFSTSLVFFNIGIGVIFYTCIVDSMNVVDAIYFCTVTVTTVGYGDIKPTTNESRAFTMAYAIIGTAITANALSTFHIHMMEQARNKKYNELLARKLDLLSLEQMDSDGDKRVTRGEYILHKVVEMGLIDEEMLQAASQRFDKLDLNKDGHLTPADILKHDGKVILSKR